MRDNHRRVGESRNDGRTMPRTACNCCKSGDGNRAYFSSRGPSRGCGLKAGTGWYGEWSSTRGFSGKMLLEQVMRNSRCAVWIWGHNTDLWRYYLWAIGGILMRRFFQLIRTSNTKNINFELLKSSKVCSRTLKIINNFRIGEISISVGNDSKLFCNNLQIHITSVLDN